MRVKQKNRKIIILIIGILFIGVLGSLGNRIKQYNLNGVSIRPCFTVDKTKPKEFICEVSGDKIYVVNLKDIYVLDVHASQMDLKEALEEKVLTIEDMLKVCKMQKNNEYNIYMGENYQIIQEEKTYLIAPLDYEYNCYR